MVFPARGAGARCSPRAWRAHPAGVERAAAGRADRRRHGAHVVVGGALPRPGQRPRGGHRQRDPHARRPAGLPGAEQCRRDPQLLGAGAGRQDGHGARPRAAPAAAGRPARQLARPVRRVLRRAARAHGAARGGAGARRLRRLAGGAGAARAPRPTTRAASAGARPSWRSAATPATRCAAWPRKAGSGPTSRTSAAACTSAPARCPTTPGALAHWIAHAQDVKPGARMPSSERHRRATRCRRWPPGWSSCNETTRPTRLPSSLPRPPGELEALERAWAPPNGWRLLSRGQQHATSACSTSPPRCCSSCWPACWRC